MFGGRKKYKAARTGTDTLVGRHTELYGDLRFSGPVRLHVDGSIHGNVWAEDSSDALLTVSKEGTIEGEVRVPNIILDGTVLGDVYASAHIELAPNARVTGNVYYTLIEMAMGAEVNGNLVRTQGEAETPIALEHDEALTATD
jgi:cytoskeletal protein CcmA (bactofilin family)